MDTTDCPGVRREALAALLEHGVGCSFWLTDVDTPGDGSYRVTDLDGDVASVSLVTVERGLYLLRSGKARMSSDLLTPLLRFDATDGREGDFDAESATALVQIGLYGRIVFG